MLLLLLLLQTKNFHVVAAIENGPSAIDLKPQQCGR